MPSANRTRDHAVIRRWIEDRGGFPVIEKGTETGIRVEFPGGTAGASPDLARADWDRWFRNFDENGLVFLYAVDPDERFYKFVRPAPLEDAGEEVPHTTVHVLPSDRGWMVRVTGEDRLEEHHRTKEEAVERAREHARSHVPSDLVIHRADGVVEEEYAFESGSPDTRAR